MIQKKILFILPSLRAGGAERISSFIANCIKEKYIVKLIVLGFKKDSVYDVSKIDVLYLNKKRLLNSIYLLFLVLLKEKPNIVFSSISHVNNLMGLFSIFFRNIKFVAREANVLSELMKFSNLKSRLNFKLINFFYSKLDLIICQSIDMKKDLKKFTKIKPNKLVVINNPITSKLDVNSKFSHSDDIIRFITVGRLNKEKGHIRLLNILSKISNYNFKYKIIGDGSELSSIKSHIKQLKLENKVEFVSYTKNVLEEMYKSHIFLQGSYVEGFPNVLLESCIVGTPIIAFNTPGGTREIIQKGINGYLVDTEEDFLKILNIRESILNFDRKKVINSVEHRFSSKKIISEYQNLFESL